MNNDLISRSALIDTFSNTVFFDEDSKCKALDLINNAPTIKTYCYFERRCGMNKEKPFEDITLDPQGEWKRHDEWRNGEYIGGFYHVNCPCEDGYYSKWETNFCPNCGLPMKKGGAV